MIAAVYSRKSTDQAAVSDEQKSVARQIEHARAYAAAKGWTVADEHVYVDDGISGAEFAKRPGFLRLMNALKPRPSFQVLVMSEESRLGRESIETAYALKQLITADVRVFFYLEDRERTLDSPTDKIMLSLTAFADELEREKARQRVTDAMIRKAKRGHVTGGRLFGYDNVEVLGPDGRRSHVERRVNEVEAAVVRRIFSLCATGYGLKTIAKTLNADGAPSPRAQQGRSQTWAPTSVREALFRTTYRGVITWNQTRKRNRWGQHAQTARPETEWISVPAPHLRLVTDDEWAAAHRQLDAARAAYLQGTHGQPFGRPPVGNPSKYLLTNMTTCGACGATMKVVSRDSGGVRRRFLVCASYHNRGRSVCANGGHVPMADADSLVLEALLDDVLDQTMLEDAVEAALGLVTGGDDDGSRRRLDALDQAIRTVEGERQRLADAIATGGDLGALLDALKSREARLHQLRMDRDALIVSGPTVDPRAVRTELLALAADWRSVLAQEPARARPVLAHLLVGRVRFTPLEHRRWRLDGQGTLAGLFSRVTPFNALPGMDRPLGMASPQGMARLYFDGPLAA